MTKEYKNKLIQVAPDSYVAIPGFDYFKNRNMASRIHKNKRIKNRKTIKQNFFTELRNNGII
jgi:hypothetical protein